MLARASLRSTTTKAVVRLGKLWLVLIPGISTQGARSPCTPDPHVWNVAYIGHIGMVSVGNVVHYAMLEAFG